MRIWRRRVLLSPAKLVLFQASPFTRVETSAVSARCPPKRREIAKDWPEKSGADAGPTAYRWRVAAQSATQAACGSTSPTRILMPARSRPSPYGRERAARCASAHSPALSAWPSSASTASACGRARGDDPDFGVAVEFAGRHGLRAARAGPRPGAADFVRRSHARLISPLCLIAEAFLRW
jgi:hypothetical protein